MIIFTNVQVYFEPFYIFMFTKCKFYKIDLYMFVFTKLVLLYRIYIELMADSWYGDWNYKSAKL